MSKLLTRLCAGLLALLLCGCSAFGRDVYIVSSDDREKVFEIGELVCQKNELLVYLANYKNLYGTLYGTDVWANGKDLDKLKASIKKAAFAQLTQIYALNNYASKNEIALTEVEVAMCAQAAEDYYSTLSEQEIEYLSVSVESISSMYERYALANKTYAGLVRKVDPEVSEDDARVMDVIVIYTTNQEQAKEAMQKINDGSSFTTVAETYSKQANLYASIARGELSEIREKAVFALADDQYTDIIEDNGAYYIYYCTEKYNQELSEARKSVIYEERINQVLEELYSASSGYGQSILYEEKYDEIEVNTEEWLSTDSFFKTYEEYQNFSW